MIRLEDFGRSDVPQAAVHRVLEQVMGAGAIPASSHFFDMGWRGVSASGSDGRTLRYRSLAKSDMFLASEMPGTPSRIYRGSQVGNLAASPSLLKQVLSKPCLCRRLAKLEAVVETAQDVTFGIEIYLNDAEQGGTGTLDLRSWEKHTRDALTFPQHTLAALEEKPR